MFEAFSIDSEDVGFLTPKPKIELPSPPVREEAFMVRPDGSYAGNFTKLDGVVTGAPKDSIEVPTAPSHGLDTWDFEAGEWIPYPVPDISGFMLDVMGSEMLLNDDKVKVMAWFPLLQSFDDNALLMQQGWAILKTNLSPLAIGIVEALAVVRNVPLVEVQQNE